MVKTTLIHPEIISALAYCGHGSRILIADGNYPLAEKTGSARKVYLGLQRNLPTVTDVLKNIHTVVNIESYTVMAPEEGPEPEIFAEFRQELGPDIPVKKLGRYEFYDECMADNTIVLAVSTGEQRIYANIILAIGCA